VDPIRNPYAPGAGQRPPELAGRDAELDGFDVVLRRVGNGRPERSMVLTGLRGVGKTVLLNAMRSLAVRRGWGTGKLEVRPDQSLRRPLAAALHVAVRELGGPGERTEDALGVIRAFVEREAGSSAKLRDRWNPGITVPPAVGRGDSGDIEIDLVEVLSDLGGLAADRASGIALFFDELQDLGPDDVSALCAACHELGQLGLPLIVVGAGLPHLPAVLSASKSYSERLFRYARIDRLDREAADRALSAPAAEEGAAFEPEALERLYAVTSGYPYFLQAYGKVTWDVAVTSPITAADIDVAVPQAEAELAVGFFGSRYERATPAERDYLRAIADATPNAPSPDAASARDRTAAGDGTAATAQVAKLLGRSAQSLSPARDALIKKGLIYSGHRGRVAFTVPHFGAYLRTQT